MGWVEGRVMEGEGQGERNTDNERKNRADEREEGNDMMTERLKEKETRAGKGKRGREGDD